MYTAKPAVYTIMLVVYGDVHYYIARGGYFEQ